MRTAPVLYHDDDAVYHADTCDPLREAAKSGEAQLAALARGSYPGRRLPPRLTPEVRSVGSWDISRPQRWGLDWHRNEGLEITYAARGRLWFEVEGTGSLLRRGDLTVTRPWQLHRVGDPRVGPSRLGWLILDVGVRRPNQAWRWPNWLVLGRSDLKRLTELLRHSEQPVWRSSDGAARAMESLMDTAAAKPLSESRLKLHINELLVGLLETLESSNPTLDRRLSTTERTVELFLADLPRTVGHRWTLAEMASRCGLAKTRFVHYCRQLTNLSPVDYLTRCRIDEARRLLTETNESVTLIAGRCGFETSQYFATVFRHHTGMTPRDFRARRATTMLTAPRRPASATGAAVSRSL